ncbi:MAG: hypothetical protein ABEH65_09790 [Halobacteriales archaeon]
MRLTLHRTATILLAVVLLTTGVVAAAPENADSAVGAEDDSAGPPSDLPGPVPDFVSTIHDLITQFINGALDGSLGSAISEQIGGGSSSAE